MAYKTAVFIFYTFIPRFSVFLAEKLIGTTKFIKQ